MFQRRAFLEWTVLLFLVVAPARPAAGQAIFIDPCGIQIPQFGTGTLHVWVCVEGAILDGITGAQFRITGLPANWITTVTPTAPATLLGDLFGSGVGVSTGGCATGEGFGGGRYLELCTVQLTPLTDASDVLLAATASDPPQPAPFDCPITFLCDDPVFTKVCCNGYGSWVNPLQFGCGLPVQDVTWSGIKNLYQ